MKISFGTVAWIGLFTAFFLIGFSPVRHDDPFMYFAIARDFFRTGVFPSHDPYVFWPPDGAPWDVMHATGGFLTFYTSYLLLGWFGLALLKILSGFAAFAGPMYFAFRNWRNSWFHYIVFLAATLAYAIRFADRTSTMGDALLGLALLVSVLDWQGHAKARWFFPVISLVWVQVHGSFPLCWIMCAVWLGCYFLIQDWRGFLDRIPVFVATVTITICNRFGLDGVLQPFRFREFQTKFLEKYVFEWEPTFSKTKLAAPEVWIFMALILMVYGLFILSFFQGFNKKKVYYFVMLPVLTYFSIKAIRFVSLGAIGFSLLSLTVPVQLPVSKKWMTAVMAAVSVVLVIWMASGHFTSVGMRLRFGYGPNPDRFNEKVVEVLKYLPERGPVWNSFDYGCYLAWHLDGKKKYFIHGFVTDLRVLQRYFDGMNAFRTRERFDVFSKKYGINEVLITKKETHNALSTMINHPEWKLIAEDEFGLLFERKETVPVP